MEFRVLGPLEVAEAGRPIPLGGPRQRAILALLVLGANEVVPRERLIADVWGDDPPAEVEATLRVYVARLRKLLGPTVTLEAFRNGYVLRVVPEVVDLSRFEALVAAGEDALASGHANDASKQLVDALALWRGPALVDVSDEHGVAREARRLDELRLRALELRNDAELALGRHADLVPQLEALVAAEPYREQFAAQLMLALYRSGRQTEALSVYGRLRTTLHDEFGLEPTPAVRELERRVLAQDPALAAPARTPPSVGRAPPKRRPFRRPVVAAAAVAVALGLIGGLSASEGGRALPSAQPVVLRGDSVVAIDEHTGDVLGETVIGGRPGGVATGPGSVWVVNIDDDTLLRIDPKSRRIVDTIGLGVVPCAVAVGGGSVWVVSCVSRKVLEVDPAVNDVVATIGLPRELFGGYGIVFARGAVWVRNGVYPGELLRIDPRTHVAAVVHRDLRSIASDGSALWAIVGTYTNSLRRLYPPGGATRLDNLGGSNPGPTFVATGAGYVWTVSAGGTLWRIDPDAARVIGSVPLRRRIGGVAGGQRDVWVVTSDGHLVRVDGEAARIVSTVRLGVYPSLGPSIAVGEGGVWISAVR